MCSESPLVLKVAIDITWTVLEPTKLAGFGGADIWKNSKSNNTALLRNLSTKIMLLTCFLGNSVKFSFQQRMHGDSSNRTCYFLTLRFSLYRKKCLVKSWKIKLSPWSILLVCTKEWIFLVVFLGFFETCCGINIFWSLQILMEEEI